MGHGTHWLRRATQIWLGKSEVMKEKIMKKGRTRPIYVTPINESWHTYEWVMWFVWMSHAKTWYGVATTSRLLKIIGLFCKRTQPKRRYSAKETCNLKDPTNRSHPIRNHVHMWKQGQRDHAQWVMSHIWMRHVTHIWVSDDTVIQLNAEQGNCMSHI